MKITSGAVAAVHAGVMIRVHLRYGSTEVIRKQNVQWKTGVGSRESSAYWIFC